MVECLLYDPVHRDEAVLLWSSTCVTYYNFLSAWRSHIIDKRWEIMNTIKQLSKYSTKHQHHISWIYHKYCSLVMPTDWSSYEIGLIAKAMHVQRNAVNACRSLWEPSLVKRRMLSPSDLHCFYCKGDLKESTPLTLQNVMILNDAAHHNQFYIPGKYVMDPDHLLGSVLPDKLYLSLRHINTRRYQIPDGPTPWCRPMSTVPDYFWDIHAQKSGGPGPDLARNPFIFRSDHLPCMKELKIHYCHGIYRVLSCFEPDNPIYAVNKNILALGYRGCVTCRRPLRNFQYLVRIADAVRYWCHACETRYKAYHQCWPRFIDVDGKKLPCAVLGK